MSETNHLQDGFANFRTILQADKERRAKRYSELAKIILAIPVADEILKEVVWLGPTDRDEILRSHPGYSIERKLLSLWSMLDVFNKSHLDLVAQLDQFHAFSLTDEMHLPTGKPLLAAVQIAVNKELVAFSASAAALVAFSRRLKGPFTILEFQSRLTETFDAQEHAFVTALRNVICHSEFPDISWQIHHAEERTTDFILFSEGLKQDAMLNAEARAFVDRCGSSIQVRAVANAYAKRVQRFYAWYRQVTDEHKPNTLVDYRRALRACKANSRRATFGLFLQQFLNRKIDPYQHLHKYLLPSQIQEALALPMRSREQVDFIISAADEDGACDDALRRGIYQLFGLP